MSARLQRSSKRAMALLVAAVAAIDLLAPRLALACAVCTAGRDDENQTAFLLSTIFLSLLPLAALGTLVFVLWRRFQRLESASKDARTPVESAPRPA